MPIWLARATAAFCDFKGLPNCIRRAGLWSAVVVSACCAYTYFEVGVLWSGWSPEQTPPRLPPVPAAAMSAMAGVHPSINMTDPVTGALLPCYANSADPNCTTFRRAHSGEKEAAARLRRLVSSLRSGEGGERQPAAHQCMLFLLRARACSAARSRKVMPPACAPVVQSGPTTSSPSALPCPTWWAAPSTTSAR